VLSPFQGGIKIYHCLDLNESSIQNPVFRPYYSTACNEDNQHVKNATVPIYPEYFLPFLRLRDARMFTNASLQAEYHDVPLSAGKNMISNMLIPASSHLIKLVQLINRVTQMYSLLLQLNMVHYAPHKKSVNKILIKCNQLYIF